MPSGVACHVFAVLVGWRNRGSRSSFEMSCFLEQLLFCHRCLGISMKRRIEPEYQPSIRDVLMRSLPCARLGVHSRTPEKFFALVKAMAEPCARTVAARVAPGHAWAALRDSHRHASARPYSQACRPTSAEEQGMLNTRARRRCKSRGQAGT